MVQIRSCLRTILGVVGGPPTCTFGPISLKYPVMQLAVMQLAGALPLLLRMGEWGEAVGMPPFCKSAEVLKIGPSSDVSHTAIPNVCLLHLEYLSSDLFFSALIHPLKFCGIP